MAQLTAMVDKLLTKVSSGYVPAGLVCEQILPLIEVVQYSGLLGAYGNQHLRIETSVKGGRGKYRRVESITRSTSQYLVQGHGLEGMVSKEDYANVEDPFNAEQDEVLGLSTKLFIEKEKSLADSLTSTGTITSNTTLSGTSQFNDYSNSDPLTKFGDARSTIRGNVGVAPDTAIMDWAVFQKLKYHPQMLDAMGYKYDRPGGLKAEELMSAMEVKKILIAEGMYNSAAEGQADVLSPIWGKHIVFAVCPDKADKMQISLGYRVQISGGQPRKVYKWDVQNPPGSKSILVEDEYQMLLSKVGAAYLIANAIG